ncbi:unnamed protein product [Rhodiola kirilowii]
MRWLSSSPIHSWNKQLLQFPSSSRGNHYEYPSRMLSSSGVARSTLSNHRKSNPNDWYLENIKSHKRKICRGLVLKWGYTPHVIGISSLMHALCNDLRINDAALLFQKMKTHLGCQPDIVTYGILLKGLCLTGWTLFEGMLLKGMVSEAIELKSEIIVHNLTPNTCTYNILVDGLCKNGYSQEAVKLFDTMIDSKLKPNVVTYSSLIDGFCKAGKLDKALLLFDRMSSDRVAPDGTTYSVLINGLCKAEQIIEAEKLFVDMEKKGIPPNVAVAHFRRCGSSEERRGKLGFPSDKSNRTINISGQMRRSSSSIHNWKKQKLQVPSIVSSSSRGNHYEILSRMLSSSGEARSTASNHRKSNHVEGYIEKIKSHKRQIARGLLPDFVDLSWLMGSYSKIGCTEYGFGVLGLILKWGYTPHVIGINILMNVLCQQLRINEAALLFQKMNTHLNCKPDIFTYGTLLKGLCSTGNSRIALNLHEQIADGTHELSGDLQLNLICYNTLIDGLCKDGLIDKAKELFLEMKKKDVSPDVITYNIVIDGLCRAGKWEEAQAMFHEMLDQGLEPGVVTFTVLINALAKMRKNKQAKELFSLMIQSGQMPTVVTYSSMMDCFYREGNIQELKEVFVFMDRNGITPNVVTYNILIKGYCKHGMIHEAIDEYRRMIHKRLKPDIITINALLEGMLLKSMVSEAIELKSEITAHNLTPDLCTYSILIDGLCKNGYSQEAVKLFDTMIDSKLKPDVVTYSSLVDGLCKAGKLEKALLLFDGMSRDGVVPNVTTYTILIDGLCKAEKIIEAEKLFVDMEKNGILPDVCTFGALIHGFCKIGDTNKVIELLQMMAHRQIKLDDAIDDMVITRLLKEEKYQEYINLLPTFPQRAPATVQ